MINTKFDIFKEITVGNLSKDELLHKLIRAGVQFNEYANILFSHPLFVPQLGAEKVRLVKTSLSKLELKESCSFDEFRNRMSSKGLRLCPLNLAAFLRLDYLDQQESLGANTD